MEFSQQGINLLKKIEQMRLKPYDDQTGKTMPIEKSCASFTMNKGSILSHERTSPWKETSAHSNRWA
jgi:hypothetical protein